MDEQLRNMHFNLGQMCVLQHPIIGPCSNFHRFASTERNSDSKMGERTREKRLSQFHPITAKIKIQSK